MLAIFRKKILSVKMSFNLQRLIKHNTKAFYCSKLFLFLKYLYSAANETVHKQEEKTENNDEVEENSENDEENNVENIVTSEEIVEENSTVDDLLS